MKKNIIILFLLTSSLTYSQDTNIIKYLPLQVGNVWVYHFGAYGQPPCFCNKKIRIKLVDTNVYNGKTYFQSQITTIVISCASTCGTGFLPFDSLLRVDSMSGKVLKYSAGAGCITPDEVLLDSLKARLNDTIWEYCQHPVWYSTYVCSDTNNITIFGSGKQSRRYYILGFEGGWARTYTKGIGLTSWNCYAVSCSGFGQLYGCVINGILYGDTSMLVGINQISTEIPKEYTLYQNYPNPFNPNTVIKFQVAGTSFVKLSIYDALGKEVITLVNEQLKPGTYETEFDGTNLPSGVYFYKLVAGDYTETKKLVLLK